MEGAHGAFCVTNFWEHLSPEKEVAQAQTMAQAALDAGVHHVVWSTLEDTRTLVPPGSGRMPVLMGKYNVPHFDGKGEANAAFVDRGVPTTLLYTSFYWDKLVHLGMQPQRGADGTLGFALPMDGAKLPGIAAADIGPVAFGIFVRGDEMIGKSIGIAGEHLTGAQMAEQLTLALGEPVKHIALSPAQYAALGFPGADDLANMFQLKRDFEHFYRGSRSVDCTRQLYPGRKPLRSGSPVTQRRCRSSEHCAETTMRAPSSVVALIAAALIAAALMTGRAMSATRSEPAPLPQRLSDTGLFEPGTATPRAGVLPFAPQYPLWSDGSRKQRWIVAAGQRDRRVAN